MDLADGDNGADLVALGYGVRVAKGHAKAEKAVAPPAAEDASAEPEAEKAVAPEPDESAGAITKASVRGKKS